MMKSNITKLNGRHLLSNSSDLGNFITSKQTLEQSNQFKEAKELIERPRMFFLKFKKTNIAKSLKALKMVKIGFIHIIRTI